MKLKKTNNKNNMITNGIMNGNEYNSDLYYGFKDHRIVEHHVNGGDTRFYIGD